MKKIVAIFGFLLSVILFSCNQTEKSTSEKENELLKKENELLKKEQELNNKEKADLPKETPNTDVASKKTDTWKVINHRNGFTLELPDYFKEGGLSREEEAITQYFINELNDNITLSVSTMDFGSINSLREDYKSTVNNSEGCDYKVIKDNWFVVSGTDNNGVYYYREMIKDGRTHELSVRYPTGQLGIFDKILPRISKSFR